MKTTITHDNNVDDSHRLRVSEFTCLLDASFATLYALLARQNLHVLRNQAFSSLRNPVIHKYYKKRKINCKFQLKVQKSHIFDDKENHSLMQSTRYIPSAGDRSKSGETQLSRKSYQATVCTARVRFLTGTDQPRGQLSLLSKGYQVSFLWHKAAGA